MQRVLLVLLLLLASMAGALGKPPPAKSAPAHAYAGRPEVRALIDELVAEHGFDRAALARAFAQVRFQPQIVAAMQRPMLEPPKWFEYAPPFLATARVDGGVAFWSRHEAALARAEATYGVPAEIVVAIIGVETYYGRNTGRHR